MSKVVTSSVRALVTAGTLNGNLAPASFDFGSELLPANMKHAGAFVLPLKVLSPSTEPLPAVRRQAGKADEVFRDQVSYLVSANDSILELREEGLPISVRSVALAPSAPSGDFYDVLKLPDGRVLFVVGDVSGHGVEAAHLANDIQRLMNCREPLTVESRAYASFADFVAQSSLHEVLRFIELRMEEMPGLHSEGDFVALGLAILNPHTGDLQSIQAGLPIVAVLHKSGAIDCAANVGPIGPILCGTREIEDRVSYQRLGSGDRLIFMSDGVTELRLGQDAHSQGTEKPRLQEVFLVDPGVIHRPADTPAHLILEIMRQLDSSHRKDDATILVVEMPEKTSLPNAASIAA